MDNETKLMRYRVARTFLLVFASAHSSIRLLGIRRKNMLDLRFILQRLVSPSCTPIPKETCFSYPIVIVAGVEPGCVYDDDRQ